MKEKNKNQAPAGLIRTFEVGCGYLLLAAVMVSLVEIVARVVFKASFDLFFSLPVWMTIWALMLMTGGLLPANEHVSIHFIGNRLRGKALWILEVGLALITLAWGLLITWGSSLFVGQLIRKKAVFPTYIAVPRWMVELCIPVGMGIFSGFALAALIRAVKNKPEKERSHGLD